MSAIKADYVDILVFVSVCHAGILRALPLGSTQSHRDQSNGNTHTVKQRGKET